MSRGVRKSVKYRKQTYLGHHKDMVLPLHVGDQHDKVHRRVLGANFMHRFVHGNMTVDKVNLVVVTRVKSFFMAALVSAVTSVTAAKRRRVVCAGRN